jgi:hypothetical protein
MPMSPPDSGQQAFSQAEAAAAPSEASSQQQELCRKSSKEPGALPSGGHGAPVVLGRKRDRSGSGAVGSLEVRGEATRGQSGEGLHRGTGMQSGREAPTKIAPGQVVAHSRNRTAQPQDEASMHSLQRGGVHSGEGVVVPQGQSEQGMRQGAGMPSGREVPHMRLVQGEGLILRASVVPQWQSGEGRQGAAAVECARRVLCCVAMLARKHAAFVDALLPLMLASKRGFKWPQMACLHALLAQHLSGQICKGQRADNNAHWHLGRRLGVLRGPVNLWEPKLRLAGSLKPPKQPYSSQQRHDHVNTGDSAVHHVNAPEDCAAISCTSQVRDKAEAVQARRAAADHLVHEEHVQRGEALGSENAAAPAVGSEAGMMGPSRSEHRQSGLGERMGDDSRSKTNAEQEVVCTCLTCVWGAPAEKEVFAAVAMLVLVMNAADKLPAMLKTVPLDMRHLYKSVWNRVVIENWPVRHALPGRMLLHTGTCCESWHTPGLGND